MSEAAAAVASEVIEEKKGDLVIPTEEAPLAEASQVIEDKKEDPVILTEEVPLADQLTVIFSETTDVVAEVVEQGADVIKDIAEVVESAAEKVEVAVADVAEEVKAAFEEAPPVEMGVAEGISPESVSESVIEALAPVATFVEPSPVPSALNLVEAVKAVTPQKYADLGKEARDLITKDFLKDSVHQLKAATKSANGFQFTVDKSFNCASGVVGSSLETKYLSADGDWSISAKCNTDNVLSSTVCVANQGFDGLNVDIDTSYSLVSGKKSMKVKTAYTGSSVFHPTLDLDVADINKPNIAASLVLSHEGFLAGYQTSFDSSALKLVRHNLSLSYKTNNLVLTGAVENASKILGSVYYNIKEGLSAAAHLEYTSGGSSNVTLCGKYDMGSDAHFKVKVDQNLTTGCSYTQLVRPGLSLTVSQILNAKALGKVGLSLNFEP